MGSIADKFKRLQATAQRGLNPAPTANAQPANPEYKAPAVEECDEEKGPSWEKSNTKPMPPTAPYKLSPSMLGKRLMKEIVTRSNPKRKAESDIPETQSMLKRKKLAPAVPYSEKRKSDVSMADPDEESAPSSSSSSPNNRHNREETASEALPTVQVEYEDITAEVDARMQQRQERMEHERKQELGMIDKRKRQSNDSFTLELDRKEEKGTEATKPSRKRKKRLHSVQAAYTSER